MSTATEAKPTAIVEIERLGFKYSEAAQFDLSKLDYKRRVQVREVAHYVPKESVERYAVMMGESQFPAIVLTSDEWIIDGNTRVAAAQKRGSKFFPAIVLDVEWATAPSKQQDELVALAATLNANAGVPLTAKEIRSVAAKFIALGWKADQIARAIGLKPSGVTAVKKEVNAVEKLTHVGMGSNGELRGASLRALGSEAAISLNDAPYKGLATLAADAGFNASEITTTAKNLREAGADATAIKRLDDLRTEMGDRIREHELTGGAKPPLSRQLRQHLGFVTKFVGREQELIETDPKVSGTHIEALTNAADVIAAVLGMQK
jgi:hypothetical protein